MFDSLRMPLAALMLATAAGSASAQERFTLEGSNTAVYNLVGTLHITAASGGSTEVEIRRNGRDAQDLRIATGRIGDANTLRVIYPSDEISYPGRRGNNSQTNLQVNDDGTFGRGRGDRRVRISTANRAPRDAMEAGADIIVRVPAGVRLLARLGIGDAEIRNVRGTITVSNSAGDIVANGAGGELELHTASGSIRVTDADGRLAVHTASGGVELDGIRGSELKVDVASGSIEAARIRAAAVGIKTASGRIRLRDVESETLRLSTASGGIRLSEAKATEARLHSASGSIDADLGGAIRVAEFETASGSVRVRLPEQLNAEVTIETSSGGIDIDAPLQVTTRRRGYMRGTIGTGAGRVSLSSASGSVSISTR